MIIEPRRFSLMPHPDHRPRSVKAISVELSASELYALVSWAVIGYGGVAVPEPAEPTREDELWRTTCFELFVSAGGREYVEFNFSPSTQWAAYIFSSYRRGMAPFDCAVEPDVFRSAEGVVADCEFAALPGASPRGSLSMGISAVIEETDGTKSYWALAHAPGPPDFHNPACFTATLPPPARP